MAWEYLTCQTVTNFKSVGIHALPFSDASLPTSACSFRSQASANTKYRRAVLFSVLQAHQDPGPKNNVAEHRRWSERPGRSQGQFDPWPVPIPAQSPPSRQDPGPRTSVKEHRRWSKRPGRRQQLSQ